tara:strand:- start:1044 stop:1613 length:570 start_codon:yes stop_codon:yes gene_type:complete
MFNKKEKSPAEKHLMEMAGRDKEHLTQLLAVRKILSEQQFKMTGKGAFKNSYLPLPEIIKVVEPVLYKHGFVTIFDDISNSDDLQKGQCRFVLRLIYTLTDQEITNTINMQLEKATPQGKRSAYTYAMRSLYESVFALPKEDDDATATMNVDELQSAIDTLTFKRDKLLKNQNGRTVSPDKPKIKETIL